MDLTAVLRLLIWISPLVTCIALLTIVLRSGGRRRAGALENSDIAKAKLFVSLSAAAGVLAFAIVLAVVASDREGSEIVVPVGLFAAILCVPLILWGTKWRRRATDVTALISLAMVIPFISLWPVVVSLAAMLAVAGALLKSSGTAVEVLGARTSRSYRSPNPG
ncbi:MAG: hypothetical protein ACSLFK_15795 [Gemmatimonadaceae bacterium]